MDFFTSILLTFVPSALEDSGTKEKIHQNLTIINSNIMKKTLKILIAVICSVLALSLAACQKEADSTPETAEQPILGTWIENEATYTYTQNDETNSMSMLEPGETIEMTFKSNGTYTSIYHAVEGDSYDNGTWSIHDDMITIANELGTTVYHIDQLDKTTCILSYNESDEDEDGPYTINIVMKMTKK